MKVLRFALMVCLLFGLSACSGGSSGKKESDKDGDKKGNSDRGSRATISVDKLIGKWEVTNSPNLPSGATGTIEFTKDGIFKMTSTFRGKTVAAEGTYKVEGDTITTTVKQGDKELTEKQKIKTLDDTTLITEDKMGQVDEFKRK